MLQEQRRIVAFGRAERVPTAAELHDQFLSLYDNPEIVLDLRGIDLIGVAFLAELAHLRLYRRNHGLLLGRLVVASQHVRSALSAVGFDRNWPIFKTVEEAIASFNGPQLFA